MALAGEPLQIDPGLWATSRAGARAGRGFRYQDAVGALLATRIWAGVGDSSALVPEGVDDLTLHGGAAEIRVQAKSRHDPRGRFTTSELADILVQSAQTVDPADLRSGRCRLILALERPPEALAQSDWTGCLADHADNAALIEPYLIGFLTSSGLTLAELLASCAVVTVADPLDACVALVSERTDCAEAVARLAAHRLRHLVGERADRNYRAAADQPAVVNATDVAGLLDAVLTLLDRGALFPAIAEGLCEPVSFAPVETAHFYEGVDVAPGHVAAGLVLDRPHLIADIAAGLQRQRCTLVAGPSGSGKSAAAWLFAHQNRHTVRWYRLRRARPDQAHLLIELARSLEASSQRPVGFVLDDVGRDLSGIWEALAGELRHEPGVLLLGTIREEDLFLIGNLASTAVARPELDPELAERIWSALRRDRTVAFIHWLEPFELSGRLLLEYSHLLTSGQRLQETLDAQVRRRLAESRDDELAILQAVIPAARFGAVVDADRLQARLALSAGDYARALARLVDEHAVRDLGNGRLGGLHQIRSTGLYRALCEQLPRPLAAELGEMVDIVRTEEFPLLLPQLLRERPEADAPLLDALAARAPDLPPVELAPIFHGLGLAACDRAAERWIAIVDDQSIETRHAGLTFSLALAGSRLDIPQFARLDAAIARFPEITQRDLRTELLTRIGLPSEIDGDLEDYHELMAALLPLPMLAPSPTVVTLPAGDWMAVPLEEGLALLATVREFGVELAERLLARFGGSDHLLSRIYREVAWVTRPDLSEKDGKRVIASNIRFQGDPVHPNANDIVVAHCERLMAAVPTADIASSTMLGWDGNPAGFQGFSIAVKNIPRENLPAPVRVAWNRAALRAIQSRTGPTTESGRANALSSAITELSSMLADAADLYCRGLPPEPQFEMLLSTRDLLNSFIEPPSGSSGTQSARDQGEYAAADQAFDFVFAVTKLARDLIGEIERPVFASTEAAKLHRDAETLLSADGWRWVEEAPTEPLRALSETLGQLDAILGDQHAHAEGFRRSRLNAERTSRHRRASRRFAEDARDRARNTAASVAADIRTALAAENIEAIVVSRPMDDPSAPYWPRVDYAVLLPVGQLIDFMALAEDFVEVVKRFPSTHRVSIAPVREGLIVAALAGAVYENFFPMTDFAEKWTGHVPFAFLEERAAAALAEAFNVLLQISAVFANVDRYPNEEELAYAQQLVDSVKSRLALLETLRDTEFDDDIGDTCLLIQDVLERLCRELDGDPSERLSTEFARMANGEQTEFTTRVIAYRIGLLERDILAATNAATPQEPA